MPDSDQSAEHLFLRFFQKRPQRIQQAAINRFRKREKKALKARSPELRQIDLQSTDSVFSQFKRHLLDSKIDFASLFQTMVKTMSHTPGGPQSIGESSDELPELLSHAPGGSQYSGFRLRLQKVKCVVETPGGGSDDIRLGGVGYSIAKSGKKLTPFFVGEFEEGDVKTIDPPRKLVEFKYDDDNVLIPESGKIEIPIGWPREYAFTFTLVEEDAGNFAEDFPEIFNDIKDKLIEYVKEGFQKAVEEAVGEFTEEAIKLWAKEILSTIAGIIGSAASAIGTVIGTIAGYIVGYLVDEIFAKIQEWLEDEIFIPKIIYIDIFTRFSHFGVIPISDPIRIFMPNKDDGIYELTCDIELFGKTETKSELRVKESLEPYSFVDKSAFFTLLMADNKLVKAINKWKGIEVKMAG